MQEITNFIDNADVSAQSNQWLDNPEPATGMVYSRVADSGEADIARAVEAARKAYPQWSGTPPAERGAILRRIADGIRAQLEQLALAESADTGKPISLARTLDIPRASQNFAFFADAATQYATECHASGRHLNYTLRSPLGLVGCISPWNLPLYLLTWKVAPALAAGNCVVAKPSEVTPMTAYLLGGICRAAGLPAGVLNLVHGQGATAGAALCANPEIAAISFTGSTRTGAAIAAGAGPAFKKLSLEMGGKNATLVFADCDWPHTIETVIRSAFLNQGEICLCGSRILVERSIYDRFKEELTARVRALRVGDPRLLETDQGALVSKAHYDKVLGALATAEREGGRFLCGGQRVRIEGRCRDGWFVAPTLIDGLGPGTQTNQEEIFGPVATLLPFDTDSQALALANATRYGLAASIFTGNLARAHRLSAQLRSGLVWVNCWMVRDLRTPFGGMKDSGVGREGGLESYRFFTEPKNVCVEIAT